MSFSPAGLLEHAERLIAAPAGASTKPATEEDFRRAISAAYYAVFHTVVGTIADLFSNLLDPTGSIYERIYRRPEHRDVNNCWGKYKTLCKEKGVEANLNLEKFDNGFKALYEKRSQADYNVTTLITHDDATTSIEIAHGAIQNFLAADEGARNVFLSLIVFPPRSKS
jgi:uncharacterized protein (UPF0332 family)